jgi:cell division protein FtsI (penicillin-binding protein 3)
MEVAKSTQADDVPDEDVANMSAMFDQINSLPEDDPLRQPATAAAIEENAIADERAASVARLEPPPKKGLLNLPGEVVAAFRANGETAAGTGASANVAESLPPPHVEPAVEARGNGAVVVDAGSRVAVPQFKGAALRDVVEHATDLGLRVETLGSGLAQDQVPVAGTMVPPGTEIVVRFAR